ncbi:MAG: hypothetical protein HYZ34_07990 [Ignavibacteriae bacterium]|nr:hypothetical protein [Ignavibacteriota bacterium]
MGSSSLLDIIGSFIIGGMLILMIINLTGSISKMTYTYGMDMTVQKNMTTLVQMVESDFRKIGYCADPDGFPITAKSILEAGKHNISFLADINFDKTMDTVKYYIGEDEVLDYTSNPDDVPLYRVINNVNPSYFNLGTTQFDFLYYNALGDSMAFPITKDSLKGIFSIRLTVMLQSPAAYDSLYTYAYWRQLRLSSRNLLNR